MNITAQSPISQSERAIFNQGFLAHDEGQGITTNPYPAVCQQSLRDHWVWEQGWRKADKPQ